MKEAAGEANMTVITIILIAVVAAVATPLVTNMVNNSADKACCNSLGGYVENGVCKGGSANNQSVAGMRSQCKDNQ